MRKQRCRLCRRIINGKRGGMHTPTCTVNAAQRMRDKVSAKVLVPTNTINMADMTGIEMLRYLRSLAKDQDELT